MLRHDLSGRMVFRCPGPGKMGVMNARTGAACSALAAFLSLSRGVSGMAARKASPPWAASTHSEHRGFPRYSCEKRDTRAVRAFSSGPASTSKADEKKRAEDRQDIMRSVLQASATRRDAKGYLRKYAPQKPTGSGKKSATERDQKSSKTSPSVLAPQSTIRAVDGPPQFVQGPIPQPDLATEEPLNLAIVKLRLPQSLADEALDGVAKTLSQLRNLGLPSIIVLDAGSAQSKSMYRQQAHRLQEAFDGTGSSRAAILDTAFVRKNARDPGYMPASILVQFPDVFSRFLLSGEIVIALPVMFSPDMARAEVVDPDEVVLALTKYFSGLQFTDVDEWVAPESTDSSPPPGAIASVERVIILDPMGGPPLAGQEKTPHRFINLEQEYESIMKSLRENKLANISNEARLIHSQNLTLARKVLSLLPPTSTALISTPSAAATKSTDVESVTSNVATQSHLNPLIHNLLTDKPVFSSSLPADRVRSDKADKRRGGGGSVATMIKTGMPLTIFPDPTKTPWVPPQPGQPRLRLTDRCIDLPRLQYLIEDSFDRKLDLQHYLNRVNESLAGVIIAGEYEGGAILTWEKPSHLDMETAYATGRLVPYLDKFAVLKSRQGSGGVADMVFNAMVRVCFPEGVCWRSRKDNPVNRWYFERSLGTMKLSDSNWTMFWTTPRVTLGGDLVMRDYEDVCRGVEPSWADKQLPAD